MRLFNKIQILNYLAIACARTRYEKFLQGYSSSSGWAIALIKPTINQLITWQPELHYDNLYNPAKFMKFQIYISFMGTVLP